MTPDTDRKDSLMGAIEEAITRRDLWKMPVHIWLMPDLRMVAAAATVPIDGELMGTLDSVDLADLAAMDDEGREHYAALWLDDLHRRRD